MSNARCIFAWRLPVAAPWRCQAHSHDCTEVVFVREARGLLHQDNQTSRYQDGSLFVYQPSGHHFIENEVPGEHFCLGIAGGRVRSLSQGVWRTSAEAGRHFIEISDVLKKQDSLAHERLDLLCGLVVCDVLALQKEKSLETPSRAHQARQIIDNSLELSLSLAQLARRVYVSPEYLRKLFRSEFGEAITHYILRRRLELAAHKLATTNDLVKEVAGLAGFQSEYYFSRAFRKAMGVPPSEYRKRHFLIERQDPSHSEVSNPSQNGRTSGSRSRK